MFYASSRRTESNPITAAAMRAQRLREEAGKAPVVPKLAPPVEVAPVVTADPASPRKTRPKKVSNAIADDVILRRVNRKWVQFVGEVAKAGALPVADLYRPDLVTIIRRICRAFSISPRDVLSKSRRVDLILPRQAIYYWALRLTPLSSVEIGVKLGGRDHSTIIYGVRNYRKKRQQSGRFLRTVRRAR